MCLLIIKLGFLLGVLSSEFRKGNALLPADFCVPILEGDNGRTVDGLVKLCRASAPGSTFHIRQFSDTNGPELQVRKTDEKSCEAFLKLQIQPMTGSPISAELVKHFIYQCIPFANDRSLDNIPIRAQIVVYFVSSKTVVEMNTMDLYSYVVVTDSTDVERWSGLATSKKHVGTVNTIHKLQETLERDTKFGKCLTTKFYSDNAGNCVDCSTSMDSLPAECFYYKINMASSASATSASSTSAPTTSASTTSASTTLAPTTSASTTSASTTSASTTSTSTKDILTTAAPFTSSSGYIIMGILIYFACIIGTTGVAYTLNKRNFFTKCKNKPKDEETPDHLHMATPDHYPTQATTGEENHPLLQTREPTGDGNEPNRRDSGHSSLSNLTDSPSSNRSHPGSSIEPGSDSGTENDVRFAPVHMDANAVADDNTTVKNKEIEATVLAMSPEMYPIHPSGVMVSETNEIENC